MDRDKIYTIDGMELSVPVQLDENSGKIIENYCEWIENEVYTPQGHRVMFSGTDACAHARESAPGGCPDCGSCMFYRRAAEHTWIGVCVNENNRRRGNEGKK